MRWTWIAGAAGVAALAACSGQKKAQAAIPRQAFVQANADLRSIPDTVANGDSLRAAALKKRHVTEADLRRFVDVHGRNLDYMSTIWREVSDTVQKRYDRSFQLAHPTHDRPDAGAGAPDQRPDAVKPPHERTLPPPATTEDPQQPPRRGLTPQRPHPPQLPVNPPRMTPQTPPRMKPPTEPPADTKPWALAHPDTLQRPKP